MQVLLPVSIFSFNKDKSELDLSSHSIFLCLINQDDLISIIHKLETKFPLFWVFVPVGLTRPLKVVGEKTCG